MIQGRRVLPIGLLALALGGGGVWAMTADERSPSAAKPRKPAAENPDAVVDCQTRGQLIPARDPEPLQGPDYIGVGPVTLTTWFHDEPRRTFDPEPGRTKPIKAAIFVDAGPAVTISLVGGSSRRAKIEVDLDRGRSPRVTAIRLVPCPPDATVASRRVGRRTPFSAGYRIEGPMCMRVEVLADDAAEAIRKRIPFGEDTCRRS